MGGQSSKQKKQVASAASGAITTRDLSTQFREYQLSPSVRTELDRLKASFPPPSPCDNDMYNVLKYCDFQGAIPKWGEHRNNLHLIPPDCVLNDAEVRRGYVDWKDNLTQCTRFHEEAGGGIGNYSRENRNLLTNEALKQLLKRMRTLKLEILALYQSIPENEKGKYERPVRYVEKAVLSPNEYQMSYLVKPGGGLKEVPISYQWVSINALIELYHEMRDLAIRMDKERRGTAIPEPSFAKRRR